MLFTHLWCEKPSFKVLNTNNFEALAVVLWRNDYIDCSPPESPDCSHVNVIIRDGGSMQLWGQTLTELQCASLQQHGHPHCDHNDYAFIRTPLRHSESFTARNIHSCICFQHGLIVSVGMLLSELLGGGAWIESRRLWLLYPQYSNNAVSSVPHPLSLHSLYNWGISRL